MTKKMGTGLRGQIAGKTALCTVGKSGSGLTYLGYDVKDLANKCQFEEVAFLLIYGKLPNQAELKAYKENLQSKRGLPSALKTALEQIPADAHPMDVMRSGTSILGNLEQENEDFSNQKEIANRFLAIFPSILLYWYHFSHNGKRIETQTDCDSIGAHFLYLLHGKKPNDLFEKVMHASLILYAEHEFNASTFASRVCASTLSDIHSCVTSSIGVLRGALHGGANEAAKKMLDQWNSPDEAESGIMKMLKNKELIMGFGHAVYQVSDPRNEIIKQFSQKLSREVSRENLYAISQRVEMVMKREKNLFANADFYHASSYEFMKIPTELFTPIFVCSRVSGWCAHIFEQRADNRLIRPNAQYIGHELRAVPSIEQRK